MGPILLVTLSVERLRDPASISWRTDRSTRAWWRTTKPIVIRGNSYLKTFSMLEGSKITISTVKVLRSHLLIITVLKVSTSTEKRNLELWNGGLIIVSTSMKEPLTKMENTQEKASSQIHKVTTKGSSWTAKDTDLVCITTRPNSGMRVFILMVRSKGKGNFSTTITL